MRVEDYYLPEEGKPIYLRGKFITFEGIDGSGKTTQIKLLADWLRKQKIPVLVTSEPGDDTDLGADIRRILIRHRYNPAGCFKPLDPVTELFLYAANRRQHVKEVILPALIKGKWVLCDRYTDSTFAYQCYGHRITGGCATVEIMANAGLEPHLTILLDIPVEVAVARVGKREEMDPTYLERVRTGYLERAKAHRNRIVVIDANRPVEEVFEDVKRAVEPLLEEVKG